MRKYVLSRILLAIPTLFIVSVAIFSLMRILPGDIIMANLASQSGVEILSPEQYAAMQRELGLDRAFIPQYISWITGVMQLDLGNSLWSGDPAFDDIKKALPVTLQLGIMAYVFALLVGIPVGIWSAVKQDQPVDYAARGVSTLGIAIPEFWFATVLILVLSLGFGYAIPLGFHPVWESPWTSIQQTIMPAMILGARLSAVIMRMMRSSMLEVIRQDYIRTAQAKGLPYGVVLYRHALKNAMLPVITIIGAQMAFIFGGAVVLESIFSLPGVGNLTFNAIRLRDYTQVQANILMIAAVIISANLIVDLLYARLDPRIRYG